MLPLSTALCLVIPPIVILTIAILYFFRKEGPN
jgi:hypothetical protein